MIDNKDIPATDNVCEVLNENGAVPNLKAAREARGLSLENVFSSTRISLINLQAVESEDFDNLPPPVYARNFIRKYARTIGIDEKPLLERYERHLDRLKPLREEATVQKPWPEDGRRYRFLFLSLAAVICAGILVYAIFLYDQSGKAVSPAPSVEPAPAQVKPAPAAEPVLAPPAKVAPAVEPAPAPQKIAPAPAARNVSPPAIPSGKMRHLAIEARELTWGPDHGRPQSPLPGPSQAGRPKSSGWRMIIS